MYKSKFRWQLSAGLLCIMLLATACFKSVNDQPQSTIVSLANTETPTSTPTETPIPIEETEEPTAVDQPISDVETATATLAGTEVAQSGEGTGDNQPDPFQLSATALIQTATAVIEIQQTQTAQASGIGVFTPTPIFTPTMDPIFGSLTPVTPIQGQPTVIVPSGTDCVHEVRAGETMFRYSQNYGLPVNTIAAANGIVNPNLIIVGQRVVIPGCGTTGVRPPATSVPTFGTGGFVTQDALGGFATTVPTFTSTCGGQYVVQQYDTLFQISLACGVPVQSIANANGITDINRINMGTILVIPSQ
jgi:LysM repeat protein